MVFVILVFLAGFILWALLSGMYRPIGKFISTLYNDIEENSGMWLDDFDY